MFTVYPYEWQIQGEKGFFSVGASKTTNKVEGRGTQMANLSHIPATNINEAGTMLII